MKKLLSYKLLLLILVMLITVGWGSSSIPSVYRVHQPFVAIRTEPSLTEGAVVGTALNGQDLPVISTRWLFGDTYACVQFDPLQNCGWVPVQVGSTIYGSLVFHLYVITPQ